MRYAIDGPGRRPSSDLGRHAQRWKVALLAGLLALGGANAARAWQTAIDGPTSKVDRAVALAVDAAGNAVMTGTMASAQPFQGKFPVVKVDGATGSVLWRHDLDGTSPVIGSDGRAVALDANGDVVAAGYSGNIGTGFDFTVAKLAGATGDVLWRNDVNGAMQVYDQARAVTVDPNGDVLAAGGLQETGMGIASDFAVVKLAGANGAELWRASISGNGETTEDYAYAVAVDADGNAVAAGSIISFPANGQFSLAKFAAADGALLWRRDFQEGYRSEASAVVVDGAGDAVAVGLLDAQGFVAKLRGSDGSVAWQQHLVGTAGEGTTAYGVAIDAAGDVYVSGSAYDLYSGGDLVAWKLARDDGSEIWRHAVTTIGTSPSADYGTGIALDGHGNVAVGGSLGNNFALLRLNAADGHELMRHLLLAWPDGYGTPSKVAFDPAGDIVGAGGFELESTGTDEDMFVTKIPAIGQIEGCGNGVVDPGEQCDDGNDSSTDACLPACVPNLCVNGFAITDTKLNIRGGRAKIQGTIPVGPGGVPGGYSPSTRGAQLLLETAGNLEHPIYVALTTTTHAIPVGGTGSCATGDGWQDAGRVQTYRNVSGALDPPACTAGSAAGLQLLKLNDRTNAGHGIRFMIRMRDLAAMPAGPMRMSLVLGGTAAAAANGACGLVTFTPDQCVAKPDPASPRNYQCRQ